MRTSLFLSTLFTVSLIGGAALAERPRVVDSLRAHGDVVDKAYASPQAGRGVGAGVGSPQTAAPTPKYRPSFDRGNSRINCSDTGADCLVARGGSHMSGGGASDAAGKVGGSSRPPAFLDKILGSDRTNFNEAGLDEGMSSRAVKRAWSHGGAAGHKSVSSGAPGAATDRQGERESGDHGTDARVSCNEADECSMASKDVKKIWASASAAAGSARPVEKQVSNAARRIAEQRRAEGAVRPAASRPAEAGHAATPAHEAEHAH